MISPFASVLTKGTTAPPVYYTHQQRPHTPTSDASANDLPEQSSEAVIEGDGTPPGSATYFNKIRRKLQQQAGGVPDETESTACTNLSSLSNVRHALETAPLFCPDAVLRQGYHDAGEDNADPFGQFGLIGRRKTHRVHDSEFPAFESDGVGKRLHLVLANMNTPWSAFICGSQGAGKSHTLSCLLENGLLQSEQIGKLPNPLAAMIFHYDTYTKGLCSQVCEAAYLCSAGIPVRVLVAPSNIWAMTELYSNLPGLPKDATPPKVLPLYLSESSLDITTMLKIMGIDPNSNDVPLYMEIVMKILREMAMEGKGSGEFSYAEFRSRLDTVEWSNSQRVPLDLRLQLLDSCLKPSKYTKTDRPAPSSEDIWTSPPGSLTIVDLSDPFIGSNDACLLFAICLSNFLADRVSCGRIVALDEAHKFLTQSGAARMLTMDLTSVIRQQRHTGTRVLIATQEPTLAPELIDLCNATFVHRFLSPAWYKTLKKHLAGIDKHEAAGDKTSSLFDKIISLNTGEALLFCPTAILDTSYSSDPEVAIKTLGSGYAEIQIRSRVTFDGGKSILASETAPEMQQSPSMYNIPMHIVDKQAPPTDHDRKPDPSPEVPKKNFTTPTKNPKDSTTKNKQKQKKTPSPKISIFPEELTESHQNLPKRVRKLTMENLEKEDRIQMHKSMKEEPWHDMNESRQARLAVHTGQAMSPSQHRLNKQQQHYQQRYFDAIRRAGLDEQKKKRQELKITCY